MTLPRPLLAARLTYVALVLIATIMQLEFSPDLAAASAHLLRALNPRLAWNDAIDALRNLTLFAGMGTVWVITSVAPRLGTEIRRATLAGLALSVTVEALQLFSPVRTSSIIDVMTNTGGAFVGAAATATLVATVHAARGKRSYFGIPTLLLAGSYAVAVICEAVTPLFRSEPIPGISGGPVRRLELTLSLARSFDLGQIPWLDILLFGPAAFLVVMLLVEQGAAAQRVWRKVALAGALLVLLLEPAHGAVGVSVRWEAAVTHALAMVLGAWAAPRLLPLLTQQLRGSARARAVEFGYAVLLVAWGCRPFWPRTDLDDIRRQFVASQFMPLESLAVRADVFSAMHVAQQFFLYLPLGALLAVWPWRRNGFWSALNPGLLLAVAIELSHIVTDERLFDITNAMLACAGLVVGWIVVRRSGFAPYGEALRPA
jgi:glycopeptide antibiotics resistance protein